MKIDIWVGHKDMIEGIGLPVDYNILYNTKILLSL